MSNGKVMVLVDFMRERLKERIRSSISENADSFVAKVTQSLLGVKVDHWGKIDYISHDTYKGIVEDPDVQERLRQHKIDVIAQVALFQVPKAMMNRMVKSTAQNILASVSSTVQSKLLKVYSGRYADHIEAQVMAELKKDEEFAAFMVADRLARANAKPGSMV